MDNKRIRTIIFAVSLMVLAPTCWFHPYQLYLDESAQFERSISMSHIEYKVSLGQKNAEILQVAYSANVLPVFICAGLLVALALLGILVRDSRREQRQVARYLTIGVGIYYVLLVGYFVYLPTQLYVSVLPNWPAVLPFLTLAGCYWVRHTVEMDYQQEDLANSAAYVAEQRRLRKKQIEQDELNKRK